MIDTRVVKNILIETLVNSDADVSFILSYTNLVKPIGTMSRKRSHKIDKF